MHYRFVRALLLLTVLLSFSNVRAQSTDQNYPVTAQPFIVSQPNQRLSSYFSSSTALTVNLLLKDLTKNSIQVYLKWSMEGSGVRVASQDGYIPANLITLDKGTIRRFSGLDLQNDYFRQDLIEEQGLGGSPLRTNLPEGFYTFRVQALEAGTGREVSNIGETYFSITTPLPPIINIPFNGAELTMTEPQRVNIQWMPRHYRMPGNITSYDLKVCKVPDGYEPTEALDACVNPVIDDKGNPGTFYPGNTGIGSSLIGALERGARYAARVTVHEFDTDGNEVVFVNEGRSEVNWFRYGKQCVSPESFVITETGPGRLQLNWAAAAVAAQADVDSYKVLYRKMGDTKWTAQTVSATTASITDLALGSYEFAIQSGCTDLFPDHVQTFEVTDKSDDFENLPIVLTDPMQIPVQVSGCTAVTPGELADYYVNFPRVDRTGADAPVLSDTTGKLKLPGCALQSSAFSVCSPEHPMVPLPTGGIELTNLKTGDVLGIYDFAVFVTEVSGSGSFSGKGLVRLPFLEGTLALAEFSGVKAIRSDDGNGGCVYEATDFRLLNVSQSEVAAAKSKLLSTLAQQADPAAYAGTLAGALAGYETLADSRVPSTASDSLFCPYKTAILQASEEIRKALVEIGEDNPDPRITDILTDLKTITDQLTTGSPKIDSITQKYQDLISKLDSLTKDMQTDGPGSTPTNPAYAIRNVQVGSVDNVSARINWELSGGTASKYIIEYQDKDGAILQETVTSPLIDLSRLREGMEYKYRILAYDGDKVIAAYGQDVFQTIKRSIGNPQNLQYAPKTDDSKVVRITWDANKDHRTYKLVYVDQNGIENTMYPTTNQADISGLERNRSYPYRIMAYGDDGLFSEEVPGQFNVGTVCEISLVGSSLRVMPGTPVTLTVYGCYDEFNKPGTVAWEDDGNSSIGQTETITVTPQLTTTYKVSCILDKLLENGQKDRDGCSKRETVVVEKKCEGVTATASAVSIDYGAPLILRSTGCDGQIQWKDELNQGNLVGSERNILIYPKETKTYILSCIKDASTCFIQTEKVTVVSLCNSFKLAASSQGAQLKKNRIITVKAVGCTSEIEWNIEEKRKNLNTSSPDKNTVTYSNVGDGFTVNAKCKETGCTAKTDYIDEPSDQACVLRVKLIEENSETIKLSVDHADTGFKWDDTALSDSPRTIPTPKQSQVYSVSSVYSNGSRYCEGAYAYEVKRGGQEPVIIPCIDFKVSVPAAVVVLRGGITKNVIVTALGCSDGVTSGKVTWFKNGKSLGAGAGANYSFTVPFNKTDADAGSVQISATCDKTSQKIDVDVKVREETADEEACRKKVTNFYAWVEPPVSMEGSFFEPKYGARAKVYVIGCKGEIFWHSLPHKDKTEDIGSQPSESESEVWFSVPIMETGYYTVTCRPTCGADKSQRVIVKVRQTAEDKAEYPPIVTSPNDVKNYSEPDKECGYHESTLTVPLGEFIPKSQEENRGGYNHIIESGADQKPFQMALSASYCYNGSEVQKPRGEPRWFSDPSRTQLYENYESGITIIKNIPKVKTTYYGRCYYKKDKYCDFAMTITIPTKSGRESAETETELTQAETGPVIERDCVYPTASAVTALLDNLLCQKLALLPGSPAQKLTAVRDELLKQGITLATVSDQMIKLLAEGKCSEVTKLLTKEITGNEKVDKLDGLVDKKNIDKLFSDVVDVISVELLSLTATATDATCAADDGVINLEATGGVAPYQYSIDGTIFQDNPVFVELKVGTYTITVRDSKSAVATATASIMLVPDLVNVEMSSYQPPVTAANTRTLQSPTITVQWGTKGVPYTFTPKTGVTIEYIAGGKVHVTTTDEADKQYNGDYGVYFENNHDIFVGFYKGTNLQKCSPSGYGIDCQPMCKEGFLPQEIYDESFVPYVLAASVHRKGMNDDNTGVHHDMESCDMESDQIIALNALCESELSNQLTETDLINEWKRMASFQSMGKLGNNIEAMIDKFARSEGGEYSNTDLTSAGKNHKSTRRFIDNIKVSLSYELAKDTDFIKSKGKLSYVVNGEVIIARKDIPSPTWGDKFSGLGIAVNDTWGYDVKIESFTIDKVSRSYQAKISVEIFDHFGLDGNDIDPTIKPEFAILSGFRSWFVLQHSKKYCKKPFVTIVNFEESINGTY